MEAKGKLETQLEKAKNDIFQLQHEKDLSAKELLNTKTGIYYYYYIFCCYSLLLEIDD